VPPESSGGGAERHGYYLANKLAELGHEIHFVSKHRPGAEFHPSVKVYPVPPKRVVIPPKTSFLGWVLKHLFGNLLSFLTMIRILVNERFRFDLIHCHGALAALLLSKFAGWRVPVVYTMHDASPWITSYPGVGERVFRKLAYFLVDVPCLRSVSHIIGVSPALVAEATRLGAPASNVAFIPSGIRVPLTPKHVGQSRIPLGLFVGQLVRRKRVDLIISAASKLADQNVAFVIVGSGPEEHSLVRLSAHLGTDDRVKFAGYVDDRTLSKYYEEASFFFFPSQAEGFGVAMFEAMAYGLPVLASRLNVYDGLLSHGENALLFKSGDVDEIVRCVEMIVRDSELRDKLSSNGIPFARDNFSWQTIAKHVASVYSFAVRSRSA